MTTRRWRHVPLTWLLAAWLVGLMPACGAPSVTPAVTPTPEPARLTAEKLRVSYRSRGAAEEDLPVQAPRAVQTDDRIVVYETGEALLRFQDFLTVRLFHDSRLEFGCDQTVAPALCYRLEAGAAFNALTPAQAAGQRLQIETDGGAVVIRNTGTSYLIDVDPASRLTWVVVAEGVARVAAAGHEVSVGAREQTWVEPDQPPVPPQPAARSVVGGRFPPVDTLTGGMYGEADLLPIAAPSSTPTASPRPALTPTATSVAAVRTPTGTPRPPATPTRPVATLTATRLVSTATVTSTATRLVSSPTATPPPTRLVSTPTASPTPTRPVPSPTPGGVAGSAITTGHDVSSLAIAPDGRTIVAGGVGSQVTLWDIPTRRLVRTLKAASGGLFSVAIAPDGRLVAAAHGDNAIGLWETASGALLRTIDDVPLVEDLAFALDGRGLVGVSAGTIHLWDVASGRRVRSFEEPRLRASSIAVTPDGTTLVAGMAPDGDTGGPVLLWDIATGKVLRALRGHALRVTDIAVAARGTRLASAGVDSTVRVWDATTGEALATWAGDMQGVAISPDGTLVAAGGHDGLVKLWEVPSRQVRTFAGHTGPVTTLAFTPDGARLASGGDDDTIRVWDLTGSR